MKILLLIMLSFTLLGASKLNLKEKTNAQKGEDAVKLISNMGNLYSNTHKLLKKARKDKDIIKLNCVNENFKKIDGLLRSSKDDRINLDESIAKDDLKAVNHYYTKIFLANDSIIEANEAAKTCSGSIIVYADDKPIQLEVEEILTDEDYEKESAILVDVYVPVPVSPYF